MSKRLSKNFYSHELWSPDDRSLELETGFLDALQNWRTESKVPFNVTSCCRTDLYNHGLKGHPRSLHLISNHHHNWRGKPLRTCAIDLRRPDDPEDLRMMIEHALKLNWSLILYEKHIHADRRSSHLFKPQVFMTNFDGILK